MRPVLFELGPLEVRSWGVLVALAFVAAGVVLRSELTRRLGRGDAAYPIVLAAAVGGMVGARFYWMAEHLGEVGVLDSFSGAGFTWYGGALGGALGALAAARYQRIQVAALLGSAAPALALGYAVGRIACQLAGDGTYGVASDLPWAMSYPDGEVPTSEQVHPTPIYESLASLAIFGYLWSRRQSETPLRLFASYLVLAGLERFLVEFVRRNDDVVLGMTQPQLFALAMIAAGVVLVRGRRGIGEPQPGAPVLDGRAKALGGKVVG